MLELWKEEQLALGTKAGRVETELPFLRYHWLGKCFQCKTPECKAHLVVVLGLN